jgi:uncharacterized membrane protein
MSLYWLFFASLTVVGSLLYNVGMKFGTEGANPFGFAFILASVEFGVMGLCCLVSRYAFKISATQGMNAHAIKLAAMAGFGVALVDVCYFFALRYGSLIASQMFWVVGGTVALVIFSVLFFGEALTLAKAAGIACGIASVILITK